MQHDTTGHGALDRFKAYLDGHDLVCPECGYDDAHGHWSAETDGAEIHYRHRCPSCGSVQARAVKIDES